MTENMSPCINLRAAGKTKPAIWANSMLPLSDEAGKVLIVLKRTERSFCNTPGYLF